PGRGVAAGPRGGKGPGAARRRPWGGPAGPPGGARRRTRWPGGKTAKASTAQRTTAAVTTPLETRWVNSITVSSAGARGTSSPLHAGQWAPQPAPEPVARTKAPHTTTARRKARRAQVQRA